MEGLAAVAGLVVAAVAAAAERAPVVPVVGLVAVREVRARSGAGVPAAPRVSEAVRSRVVRRFASC